MCYVIENEDNNSMDSTDIMAITIEKKTEIEIKELKVRVTSQYDYLTATHHDWGRTR